MAVKYDADADKEGVASGSKAPPSSPIHDDNQTDPTFQALTPMIEEQYVYYPEDVFVMIQVVRIRWLLRLIITHLVSQVLISYMDYSPQGQYMCQTVMLVLMYYYGI
ncbi:uncharacterized protein LOC120906768 isoform X2 [Anopheles arabiensis]|uniref:uncharacterized protein LOC120906768 isoform X2 n=1 Tax=Anopheles arabiensis TaxID=7173 RepID=UPI001AADF55F|nr:uncharacterized protein LOC120906768 isoform X2 [Anopheles arabiensis]